jgi:phage-related minor tail protein
MRAPLRAHGVGATISAVFAALVAFAGAWTAGEPTSAVAVAALVAAICAFFATLTVLSVLGRTRGRVVRGKQQAQSGHDRAD